MAIILPSRKIPDEDINYFNKLKKRNTKLMSKKMRIVYIAHPIGGDVNQNLTSLRLIIRAINMQEPNTVPFCPYYADVVSLNDNDPDQRARGLKNDLAILTRPGMVDELRLYGGHISTGMKMEVETAHLMGIPIVCSSQILYTELTGILHEMGHETPAKA